MIISKINTEIETFCMDSDFRQSYPLIVFGGRGYDLDTQPCLFVPLFCLLSKTETIKKVLQYVDIVGLVSFLSPFGFVLMWSAWVMNQTLFLPQYQYFQKFRLCIRHALVLKNCLLLSGVCLPTSWVQMYALFLDYANRWK